MYLFNGSPTSHLHPQSDRTKSPARKLLAIAAGLLCAFLIFATKPWTLDVAAKHAAGTHIGLDDLIADGLWWAALANLILFLLLILCEPLWNTRLLDYTAPKPRRRFPLVPVVLILAAMAAATYWRAPRLDHSFWNDEELAMRRYVHGYYKINEDESLRYRPTKWKETLFLNTGSNNHVAQSIASRAFLGFRQLFPTSSLPHLSEPAVRLPSFIASLLGIGALGLLLCLRGSPTAGVAAAWFLTLNPWHLRYSVEARGYAFVLLFATLALIALCRAIRTGRWGPWLLYGLFQFLYMWSFPGAIYLAAAMNLCALLTIQAPFNHIEDRFSRTARFIVANLLSAALFIQLMGPSIRQILWYLKRSSIQQPMHPDWFRDVWTHATSGVRWAMDDAAVPQFLSFFEMTNGDPLRFWFFFGLVPLTCILGLLRLFAKHSLSLWISACSPWIAALLAYAHNAITGNFLFAWYLTFLLIGISIMIGLAVEFCTTEIRERDRRHFVQAAIVVAFLGIYASYTSFPRQTIRNLPRQPLRGVVDLIRGEKHNAYGPDATRIETISFGISSRQFKSYDPRMHPVDDRDDVKNLATFKDLLANARRADRPVTVVYADPSQLAGRNPELIKFIQQSGEFKELTTLPGLEEIFTYRIMKWRPRGF